MNIGNSQNAALVTPITNPTTSINAYKDALYLFEALSKVAPGEQSFNDVLNWVEELDKIADKNAACHNSTSLNGQFPTNASHLRLSKGPELRLVK